MPKIKKVTLHIDSVPMEFQVYFSEKRGGFYINDLPEKLQRVTQFINMSDTLDGLTTGLSKVIRKYNEIIKTTRKVLIVEFCVGGRVVMDRVGIGEWHGNNENPLSKYYNSGFGGVNGYGFSIDYKAAFERTIDDSVQYFELWERDGIEEEGHRTRLSENEIVIEYSQQREEFLKRIQGSMREMMMKIMEFFSTDTKQLEAIMDAGVPLLSAMNKPEKEE